MQLDVDDRLLQAMLDEADFGGDGEVEADDFVLMMRKAGVMDRAG